LEAAPPAPASTATDIDVHHAPPRCDNDATTPGPRDPGLSRFGARRHKAAAAQVITRSAAPVAETARAYWIAAGIVTACLTLWLFGQTLGQLVHAWKSEHNYSHGFLVVPFAALLLWLRRGSFPPANHPGWAGLILIVLGFALRLANERLLLASLSDWALIVWLAGACWLLAGRRVFVWALPAIAFLAFMIPLPSPIDELLSGHLQTAITRLSACLFTCLTFPAIPEGHTVFLGERVLDIEQAGSGACMGVAAVAFAIVALQRRSPLERTILILATVPVAILANAICIVVTGLLMQRGSAETAARLSHGSAGWMTIVVATVLFSLLVAWLRRLVIPVSIESGQRLLKRPATI
jgi:exosortase